MTAYDKVSLLLANRAVWEEASPFFYRLHEFQLLLPDQRETILTNSFGHTYRIEQILREIAKVRLLDIGIDSGSPGYLNLSLSLDFIKNACPNLRSITADIVILPDFVILPDHPQPPAAVLLKMLWPRLKHLELIIRYRDSCYIDPYLKLIVPGFKWSSYNIAEQGARLCYEGKLRPFWTKVFFIDRAFLVEGDTQIDDEGPPDSDDDTSVDSSDDASADSGYDLFVDDSDDDASVW